jgi:uncharacterized membrane protein YgdD (TMEM256/DUF423 family)
MRLGQVSWAGHYSQRIEMVWSLLMLRGFLLLAALFGFTGVGLGAFAAHALKSQLSPEYLAVFQAAVHYQMLHALALLALALLARQLPGRLLLAAGSLFALGIVLFSGSLYALTLSGISTLGMITPLGGLAFLAGWWCLGLAAWRLTSATL